MTPHEPCTLCGATLSIKFKRQEDINFRAARGSFDWHECVACRSMMIRPKATQEELASYYSSEYKPLKGTVQKFSLGHNNAITLRIKELRKRYTESSSFSILDIGCGNGLLIYNIKKYFPNSTAYGIDFETKYAVKNTEGLSDTHIISESYQSAQDLPVFDVISSSQVMEHLQDPEEFTEFIRLHSDADSINFHDIPNIDSASYRVFQNKWIHLDTPRHRIHYSRGALDNLFSAYTRRYLAFGTTNAFFASACLYARIPRKRLLNRGFEAMARILDPIFPPDDKVLLIAEAPSLHPSLAPGTAGPAAPRIREDQPGDPVNQRPDRV